MAEITLTIDKKVDRRCREYFKWWFPKEAYGILLGTVAGARVHVDDVWFPSVADGKRNFTRVGVSVEGDWAADAEDQAKEYGSIIVGDVHSHPYRKGETVFDAVQSEYDIRMSANHAVAGVCNVVEGERGKLRTELKWWGPTIKVRLRPEPR